MYEDKDKGILKSIIETIKDKIKSVKEKTVDKIDDDDYKEHDRKRFDQDIQTSTYTKNQYGEIWWKELNRNTDSGKKSDERSTNVASSFTCERRNTKFTSRQELRAFFIPTLISFLPDFIIHFTKLVPVKIN